MLKNRQHNDAELPANEIRTLPTENANSNSNSATASTFSGESSTSNGTISGANGINNNHDDHPVEESEELSSSVVIEVMENPNDELLALHQLEEMETTLEDGAGSSSQDDGMISSATTSTSSSVVSVDHEPPIIPAAPAAFVAAIADQPEVADFLDMDFDVEPTSTDEDEENDHAAIIRKEKLLKKEMDFAESAASRNLNGLCHHRRQDFPNFDSCAGREAVEDFDGEDDLYSGPSTSFANGDSATIPKNGFSVSNSGTLTCVQGCRACNTDTSSRRGERKSRLAASDSGKPIILGNLPFSSNAAASASSSNSAASRSAQRHHPHYSRSQQQMSYSYWTRFRCSPASVNIGGPDGLRLARSAYVGFPPAPNRRTFASRQSTTDTDFKIWSIDEAEAIQATQIGPSACGATALINVLRALGVQKKDESGTGSVDYLIKDVEKAVPTRQRANDAPVAEYLLSRSVAGTDAEDLIEAASTLTNSRVLGRFFPMTERTMEEQISRWESQEDRFGRWLLEWLRRGK